MAEEYFSTQYAQDKHDQYSIMKKLYGKYVYFYNFYIHNDSKKKIKNINYATISLKYVLRRRFYDFVNHIYYVYNTRPEDYVDIWWGVARRSSQYYGLPMFPNSNFVKSGIVSELTYKVGDYLISSLVPEFLYNPNIKNKRDKEYNLSILLPYYPEFFDAFELNAYNKAKLLNSDLFIYYKNNENILKKEFLKKKEKRNNNFVFNGGYIDTILEEIDLYGLIRPSLILMDWWIDDEEIRRYYLVPREEFISDLVKEEQLEQIPAIPQFFFFYNKTFFIFRFFFQGIAYIGPIWLIACMYALSPVRDVEKVRGIKPRFLRRILHQRYLIICHLKR